MLSNAYFLANFRFDTAENEPAKNLQNFAKFANFADPNPPNPWLGTAATATGEVHLPQSAGAQCEQRGMLHCSPIRGVRSALAAVTPPRPLEPYQLFD